MEKETSRPREFRYAVGLLAFFLYGGTCFVGLCLLLAQRQSSSAAASASAGAPAVGPVEQALWSQTALITYCVILAGMLGGALRLMSEGAGIPRNFDVQLFLRGCVQVSLGAATAFTAGFLAPFALAQRPLEATYNSWALILLGGLAGYASKGMLGDLHGSLEGMLQSLRQNVSEAFDQNVVSQTVRESVEQALAPPRPVNYEGEVLVDIALNGESILLEQYSSASEIDPQDFIGPHVTFNMGQTYIIRIRFFPSVARQQLSGLHGVRVPLRIDHGERAARVPLELIIDPGYLESRLQERTITVPADRAESQDFEIEIPARAASEEIVERKLRVKLYQNGIPYGSVTFPIANAVA